MKRLVRRTAQMERNAARRLARQTEKEQKAETWKARAEQKRAMNYIRTETREARRARREAWELGAIAPMRDHLFRSSSIGLHHGAIHVSRYQYEFEPSKEAKDEHCAWAGGSKHLCLAVKDRVVVVEGSHKGKIGPISAIDEKFGLLQIETVATVRHGRTWRLIPPTAFFFSRLGSLTSDMDRSTSTLTMSCLAQRASASPRRRSWRLPNGSPSRPCASYTPSRTMRPTRRAT
jgi:hypothetical protein